MYLYVLVCDKIIKIGDTGHTVIAIKYFIYIDDFCVFLFIEIGSNMHIKSIRFRYKNSGFEINNGF